MVSSLARNCTESAVRSVCCTTAKVGSAVEAPRTRTAAHRFVRIISAPGGLPCDGGVREPAGRALRPFSGVDEKIPNWPDSVLFGKQGGDPTIGPRRRQLSGGRGTGGSLQTAGSPPAGG